MLALLFEVTPAAGALQEYLDLAAQMKAEVEKSGGCLFLDRFRSLQREGTLLSFQVWRDEAALTRWRVHGGHHKVQTIGRARLFADYRLRVLQVLEAVETGRPDWHAAGRGIWHDPAVTVPRHLLIAESRSADSPWPTETAVESFASIYREGEFAHVAAAPAAPEDAREMLHATAGALRARLGEVERDYGKYERDEAPQYYPPLRRPA